jgi:hypothetical protein
MDIKPPENSNITQDTVPIGQDLPKEPSPIAPATPPDLTPDPLDIKESNNNNLSYKKLALVIAIIIIVLAVGGYIFAFGNKSSQKASSPPPAPAPVAKSTVPTAKVQGIQLDTKKNYGNKYASGLLPVGDGKYVTDVAKQGYVYFCSGYAKNIKTTQGGAGSRGTWFVNNNTQYDLNKKLHVQGSVAWTPSLSNTESSSTRTITTNDLPNHPTGTFPISAKDPAYAYDRNPNTIKAQSLSYALNDKPAYGNPSCVSGEVGVMLTGVALFNGFDAGGRDAGAWEVQDGCDGHPQVSGEYHYHTLSSCIKDMNVSTVIGYALDGFPITGPQVGTNNILTTSDLDGCHGLTSQVVMNGKKVSTYHYVMTQDFPYSISCFRSTAIQPPGQQGQAQQKPPNVPPTQ